MKKLVMLVRPQKAEEVCRALLAAGADRLVVQPARGFARQKEHLEEYSEGEFSLVFLPKARIECLVDDERLEAAVEAAVGAARTGSIGDGKIFVFDCFTPD